jgi:predicted RNA-binding Zn-ribbon protein involved in translation (DUF1610 family)
MRMNPKNAGEEGEYCEYHQRFFSKSFPMRNTPCKAMLEQADHQCPECGETMTLYWSRKHSYFKCEKHGILQGDGTVQFIVTKEGSTKQ